MIVYLVGQGRCSNPRIGQGVRTHNQGTAGGTAGSLPELGEGV